MVLAHIIIIHTHHCLVVIGIWSLFTHNKNMYNKNMYVQSKLIILLYGMYSQFTF